MNANQVIDQIGGTSEVARICDVTVGAVSQWRTNGIPRARLMYLQVIRPDLFRDEPEQREKEQDAA